MIDIIIIGAGFAGLTAAIYAKRAGLDAKVFEKGMYGGQVSITNEVENYPSISKISGADLSINLYEHAVNQNIEFVFEEVKKVELNNDKKVIITDNKTYEAKAVIIANGVERRKLNCEGEKEFEGKGVSYCATCDGSFYKGKDVAIVGGGNTALEDALFLANNCKTVYLIHRRDSFRGEKILSDSVKSKDNIKIIYNSTVEKIEGEKTVNSITIKNPHDNSLENLHVDGIFVAIGLEPKNDLFKGIIDIDKNGYIISDENCKTNIEGVYVAGDNRTKLLRQIVTAAADGAVAGFQAANYINTHKN